MYKQIVKKIEKYKNKEYAEYFKPYLNIKTDKDDILWGVKVPVLRQIAKKYKDISEYVLLQLLQNKVHELRETAIFIMLIKAKKEPKEMCKIYLDNLDYINNWDLIDYSAPHIVAPNVSRQVLKTLANSDYLWANRVAMVSVIYYIKQNDFKLALEFAKKFMTHPHHLMHKAAGWMLREVGKKDEKILIDFLQQYSEKMPAVMRSYAAEHLRKKMFVIKYNKKIGR